MLCCVVYDVAPRLPTVWTPPVTTPLSYHHSCELKSVLQSLGKAYKRENGARSAKQDEADEASTFLTVGKPRGPRGKRIFGMCVRPAGNHQPRGKVERFDYPVLLLRLDHHGGGRLRCGKKIP